MNSAARNHLLSAFSWSPDKLVKLQRWLQTSWNSGCTKGTGPLPEPVMNVENCWALPKSSLTSSYLSKAIRSGSQKLETIPVQDDAIQSPFSLSICPRGLSYLDPSLSHRELFLQDNRQTTPLSYTLLQPGTEIWCKLKCRQTIYLHLSKGT